MTTAWLYSPPVNRISIYPNRSRTYTSMTMKISENMLLLFSQSSANLWLLALGILSFPILYLFLLQRWKKKAIEGAGRLPPSPLKLPIRGNLHQLGKLPHRSLWKLSQEYGPVLLLQLERIPTLLISLAEMAKQVLKTHDMDCCSRAPSQGPKRLSYNFLDMCFSPYSDYWRAMRKVFVLELLSTKRAPSLWDAWEVEVSHLISSLSEASPNPVDLHEKIFSLMDGVGTRAHFSGRAIILNRLNTSPFPEPK